jgi:hypothetical protein
MWWYRNKTQQTTRQKIFQSYQVLGGLLLITLVLAVVLILISNNLDDIDKNGVKTQALVTNHETQRGKSTIYYVTYRFTVPVKNGTPQTYERRATVDREAYDRMAVGSYTPIKYMAQSPDTSRLLNVSKDDYGLTFVVVALLSTTFLEVLFIGNLAWLFRVLKRENQEKALYG